MTKHPQNKPLPGVFWAAALISLSLFLVTLFKWPLVEEVTPFGAVFIMLGLALLFLATVAWSLIHMLRDKEKTWRGAIALLTCVLTFFLLMLPIDQLWIQYNYYVNKAARNDIVSKIIDGTLEPTRTDSYGNITLGADAANVSIGGNEIVVEEHDGKKYVFFYTFRGVLDNYSGFLYVQTGGDPTLFNDFDEPRSTKLVEFDKDWYFASHR